MEKFLIVDVPIVALGIGFVVVAATLGMLGVLLVRRNVALSTLESHNDVAGFIIAVIGVLYAVVLGFVVVTVWDQFDAARSTADHEAILVRSLYREAGALGPRAVELRASIRDYAESVVNQEWKTMEEDQTDDPGTNAALNRVWLNLRAIEPQSRSQEAFYGESVTRLGEIVRIRRERLLASSSELEGPLWAVLLGGGAITIGFTLLFGLSNRWAHILMVAALAAMIGLTLFLVLSLDLPFSGDLAVKPSAMQAAIQDFPRIAAMTPP